MIVGVGVMEEVGVIEGIGVIVGVGVMLAVGVIVGVGVTDGVGGIIVYATCLPNRETNNTSSAKTKATTNCRQPWAILRRRSIKNGKRFADFI